MGTRTTRLCCYWCALMLVAGCAAKSDGKVDALEKENAELRARVAQLESVAETPASLDALYPPTADQPLLTMHMIGMAMTAEAMVADLFEQDTENAAKDFEVFAAQYKKIAELVPEWAERVPAAPVDALGEALATGDPNALMPALGKVAAVCEGCHVETLVAVQYKYHWGDTAKLELVDPVTDQETGYKQLMRSLSGNFSAVGANLAQGQKDAAVKHLAEFKSRFAALEDSCLECHTSPRAYYVGDDVKQMVEELSREIAKDAPDPAHVQEVMMAIGHESCGKCHLVHMPAALWHARIAQAQR